MSDPLLKQILQEIQGVRNDITDIKSDQQSMKQAVLKTDKRTSKMEKQLSSIES